jgi:23S rRNA (cytosine1962-C5)-methyltransferase
MTASADTNLTSAEGARPGASLPVLKLRRNEERRLRAGHLWVYSNEVDTAATPLSNFRSGEAVALRSARDEFLGYGYVNPHALICARLLSRDAAAPVNAALLEQRLRTALTLRERLYATPHYRLVFGESDGLPGLVLDRYGDVLVGQTASAGMEALMPTLESVVRQVLQPQALVWKNNGSARDLEGLPKELRCAIGSEPTELEVIEQGLKFRVALATAQKTGWFYDQAFNRALLARLLPAGARVLDVCSYAGGWAVSALRAGARAALCVDASATALTSAQNNARLNGYEVATMQGDAFDVMEQLHQQGERFDAVILDPPAFIKRRKDAPRGQAAYKKLNQFAMRLLTPEALLVSCSCSFHLAADELVGIIQAAARHEKRWVQLLAAGGQAPDHPVHPAMPETRYLKAQFARVLRE